MQFLAILSKKYPFKRYFHSYLKLLFLSCIFYFVGKIRKTCYRKERKTESPKSSYLLGNSFRLNESLKMTCARPYVWIINFLPSGGGLDCFLQPNVLPKRSKIIVTCPKSLKSSRSVNFDLPKISRMTTNFELLKIAKWPIWKSRYLKSWRC